MTRDKILVAHSDRAEVERLESILQDSGYKVTATTEGDKAYSYLTLDKDALVDRKPYHKIALISNELSHFDGTEISDRALRSGLPADIIIMSPYRSDDRLAFYRDLGAIDHIHQNPSRERLLQLINHYMSERNDGFSSEREQFYMNLYRKKVEEEVPFVLDVMQGCEDHIEAIGRSIGMCDASIETTIRAAKTHDYSKFGIRDDVRNRIIPKGSSKADDEQRHEIVRQHPLNSGRMLRRAGWVREAVLAEQHHERHNGQGYPYKIQGAPNLFQYRCMEQEVFKGRPKYICLETEVMKLPDSLLGNLHAHLKPYMDVDQPLTIIEAFDRTLCDVRNGKLRGDLFFQHYVPFLLQKYPELTKSLADYQSQQS